MLENAIAITRQTRIWNLPEEAESKLPIKCAQGELCLEEKEVLNIIHIIPSAFLGKENYSDNSFNGWFVKIENDELLTPLS